MFLVLFFPPLVFFAPPPSLPTAMSSWSLLHLDLAIVVELVSCQNNGSEMAVMLVVVVVVVVVECGRGRVAVLVLEGGQVLAEDWAAVKSWPPVKAIHGAVSTCP